MTSPDPNFLPLLRTKLYRPPISSDLILRTRLLERLERNRQRPLTLISAPAGYGKSILASFWLETSDCPSAWVSLDEDDNDLRTFLSYLMEALESGVPSLNLKIRPLLEAPSMPPMSVIARHLLNDLDQIEGYFILVLDDLHRIQEPAIYDLLGELLQHPLRNMHLVLVGRQDPPLPLTTLRARGKLTEIRMQDLCFSAPETSLLLESILQREIQELTASDWTAKTEGWVTGLRLAALSLRHLDSRDDLSIVVPQGDSLYLQEYLLAEVLSHLPKGRQEGLMKLTLLDRFCAPLCETFCPVNDEDRRVKGYQAEFFQWLQDTNLFLIPLDERGEWFRFHHLFQQLLQKWLEQQLPSKEIVKLHTQASTWFAENGLIDEALKHALAVDDNPYAVQLIEQHRNHWMNTEQWSRLDTWLQKIPTNTLENNPKLLITQAWSGVMFHSQYNKWLNTPDQAAEMLSEAAIDAVEKTMIEAEINALRTTLLYSTGEINRSIDFAEQVLENLHPESNSMRGQTALILAMAQQGVGNIDRALKTIQNTIDNDTLSTPVINTKMLMGLCVIHWLEGKISEIRQPALQLLRLGEEAKLPESISFGRYFLGSYHYIRNELVEAEPHFKAVVENRFLAREHYHAHCVFGLVLCEIAQNHNEQARQVVESLLEYILETGNTWLYTIAEAFQAELDLRLNQTVESNIWEKVADPNFVAPMYVFYIPKLTAARAMLTNDTPKRRKDAADLLDHLHDIAVSTHNRRVQIDVLALQALLYNTKGEQPAALEKLSESLVLAEPGGFIRNYVDMGPPMAELLTCLSREGFSRSYIGQILAAFPEEGRASAPVEQDSIRLGYFPLQAGLIEPLTKRELQTLRLLATELSIDEIAAEMVVSPGTVRTHTKNLYSKLDVHSRRKAVHRGKELNLL